MEYLDYSELASIYSREDEEAAELWGNTDMDVLYTRVCNTCGEEYPLCEEFFYHSRSSKYTLGYQYKCKLCYADYSRDYYSTTDHNEVRRAREEAGGKHTAQELREKWEDQDGRCYYCDVDLTREGVKVNKDHMDPLCAGGANTIDNIVWACADCNRRKGRKKTAEEFLRSFSKTAL